MFARIVLLLLQLVAEYQKSYDTVAVWNEYKLVGVSKGGHFRKKETQPLEH